METGVNNLGRQEEVCHPYTTGKGWDDRYKKFGESGAGTFVHSEKGNSLFYRSKFCRIDRCLERINSSLKGSSVLDAAGGSGKFIDFFLSRGCSFLLVTDFSQVALDKINEKYKDESVVKTQFFDLKSKGVLWNEQFDFIFVMEAIFLLETDEELAQALRNFAIALKPGGYLIISDLFPEDAPASIGSYVKYRMKGFYSEILSRNDLILVDFVPQTFVFNRNLFGRFQGLVEKMGSFLFWLDQLALNLGLVAPLNASVKYMIARKKS